MDSSIDQGSNEASPDAQQDDDAQPSIATVIASLPSRSDEERETLLRALLHGDDAMPLPAPKSKRTPDIEKAGLNPSDPAHSDDQPDHAPLPGTSTSQVIEISRGSSKKRSSEDICYPKLLREHGPSSGRKSPKTVREKGRVCYGKLLAHRVVPVHV